MELIAPVIARPIIEALQSGRRVFWLIPGGSAAQLAILVMDLIAPALRTKLHITLTDERYGPPGHEDSNWHQLELAGFNSTGAVSSPVLNGTDFLAATRSYNDYLDKELNSADYKIALFGIGADGHTAGILPHSVAADSQSWAEGYEAPNFYRITMTPAAIAELDEAFVFAAGEAKWPALSQLKDSLDISEQPAQALKKADKLTIFTDYK